MERKSPIVRWLLALWLLSSQIAGGAMVLAPVVILLTFNSTSSGQGTPGIFNFLLVLAFIMPLAFLALGIWAWVSLARKKDAIAGWTGLATLIPGIILLMAMRLYAP